MLFTVDKMYLYAVFIMEMVCRSLRRIDRAVLPARTTETDLQAGKSPLNKPLHVVIDQGIDIIQKRHYLAILLQEVDHGFISSRQHFILLILARVVRRAAVEHISAAIARLINRNTFPERKRIDGNQQGRCCLRCRFGRQNRQWKRL